MIYPPYITRQGEVLYVNIPLYLKFHDIPDTPENHAAAAEALPDIMAAHNIISATETFILHIHRHICRNCRREFVHKGKLSQCDGTNLCPNCRN